MKRHQSNHHAALLSGIFMMLAGCLEPAEFVYGDFVGQEPLRLYSEQVGVHPDTSVLEDPNNPFIGDIPAGDLKWDIESFGTDVAAFYSWASILAIEPTGEHQFYTAQNLANIYNNGLAVQEDLERVREQAIAAYQAVLDAFPEAESFDSTGTFAFELITPSYFAILDLGGIPDGAWLVVEDANGNPRVVRR